MKLNFIQIFMIAAVIVLIAVDIGTFVWTLEEMRRERPGPLLINSTMGRMFMNPINLYFSLYVFNLTNYDDFVAGQTPIVRELGPYVYRVERDKVLGHYGNNTIKFFYRETYVFEPSMSNGSIHDKITTVNYAAMAYFDPEGNSRVSAWLLHKKTLFIKTTVDEYFFSGYADPEVANNPNRVLPSTAGRYAFFTGYNDTSGYFIELVYSDTKRVNYMIDLSNWDSPSGYEKRCNKLEGTDSDFFPAFETPPRNVSICLVHLYKPWRLHFEKRFVLKHEQIARFRGGSDLFNETGDPEMDKCLCANPTHIKGTFDVSVRNMYRDLTVPVVLSRPHFLNGDPSLQNSVSGLHPDAKKHSSYIDIHARSGITIDKRIRAQTNLKLIPLKTEKVPKIIFPIFWIEMAYLPSDRDYLLDMLQKPNSVCWVALATCLSCLATCALLAGLLF